MVSAHIDQERELLESFLSNLHESLELTTEESFRVVREEALVEITEYGFHSSNGLLLTDNGFMITSYHCVNDKCLLPLRVRTGRGIIGYGIERVCYANPRYDIALVKARLHGEGRFFSLALESDYRRLDRQPALHHSRWNGKLSTEFGVFDLKNNGTVMMISSELSHVYVPSNHVVQLRGAQNVRPGCSGGPVMSADGKLVGLLFGGRGDSGSVVRMGAIVGMMAEYLQKIRA